MRYRCVIRFICMATAALFATAAGTTPARCEATDSTRPTRPTRAMTQKAAERGLAFLEKDAVKWRDERKCASCHQGVMTVWALCEAKYSGYPVQGDSLAETVKWTKERLADIDKPRDTRPGWSMVNTPAVYLSVMAQAIPRQDALSADELNRIAGHLQRHQESNGSWAWSLAPAQNRPPPVFESDEVVTLMGCMALGPHVQADADNKSAARVSRDKASAWLGRNEPNDTTQAAAFRLLLKLREGKRSRDFKRDITVFMSRQNKDGGWGQIKDLPSDAYATGQALYALNLLGVKNNHTAVQRGVAYLIAGQKEDGSWPMTSRAQPGASPFKNPVPITYFGSAWATLGLMRTVAFDPHP